MKRILLLLQLVLALSFSANILAQTAGPTTKLSVNDRMAKARAAKAVKRMTPAQPGVVPEAKQATDVKYKSPGDKTQKGPNGERVYIGDRGGKYYINKNGSKTYLSSNQ
ncbi:MAG: hypothetical protein EOO39_37375 [Cytophagaceae bacterium]|nr:MAG: hypothetical protein EOO39_37375 [Cytophagaceae bacterium]